MIVFALGFAAGGALVWVSKDWMLLKWKGASTVAADLRAKAAKVEATIKAAL